MRASPVRQTEPLCSSNSRSLQFLSLRQDRASDAFIFDARCDEHIVARLPTAPIAASFLPSDGITVDRRWYGFLSAAQGSSQPRHRLSKGEAVAPIFLNRHPIAVADKHLWQTRRAAAHDHGALQFRLDIGLADEVRENEPQRGRSADCGQPSDPDEARKIEALLLRSRHRLSQVLFNRFSLGRPQDPSLFSCGGLELGLAAHCSLRAPAPGRDPRSRSHPVRPADFVSCHRPAVLRRRNERCSRRMQSGRATQYSMVPCLSATNLDRPRQREPPAMLV